MTDRRLDAAVTAHQSLQPASHVATPAASRAAVTTATRSTITRPTAGSAACDQRTR